MTLYESSYLPFIEARSFITSLHLMGEKGWRKYRSGGQRNHRIPTHPERIYSEWMGIRDWTGYHPHLKKDHPESSYMCRQCGLVKQTNEMVRNGSYINCICKKCNSLNGVAWKKRNKSTVNKQAKIRRDKWSQEMKRKHSRQSIQSLKKYPLKRMLKAAKHRAKGKEMDFCLTPGDISIPNTCPILNIPLIKGISPSGAPSPNSPSLHRIDNSRGYVKGNVIVISWRANTLIGNATIKELSLIHDFYLGYTSPKHLEAQTGTPFPNAS